LKIAKGKNVLDLCTGSGCVIISLAKLGGLKKAIGVDISERALSIAKQNAKQLQAEVQFIQSDIYAQVEESFDIIVSNPPYIPTQDIIDLMEEVKDHEPMIALDGKKDGLYFYRIIIKGLSHHLKPDGYVFFEIGYNQGKEVSKILVDMGITDIKVIKDLAGLDRVVSGRYKKPEEPFT
jgi:release factor glutamine methyltransferase